jgi:eukaryotic-like serine/threonine-protein kinase
VRPFPQTDAAMRQVSRAGGTSPRWSRDGRELFFLSEAREMMSARVTQTGASDTPIEFARPTALFRVPDELLSYEYAFYTPWDVAPDGRFLMARNLPDSDDAPSRLVIAEHWLTELRQKLADARR